VLAAAVVEAVANSVALVVPAVLVLLFSVGTINFGVMK
jgi:hypothetical protein